MQVAEIKAYLKENKITYEELSTKSGIPIGTLKNIFSKCKTNPRLDTMQAIEKALGLTATEPPAEPTLTVKEERLIAAFNGLIPPMQDYILEMTESLVEKSPQVGTTTNAGKNTLKNR